LAVEGSATAGVDLVVGAKGAATEVASAAERETEEGAARPVA